MLTFKPETKEAMRAGRIRYFVFFDFRFVPMRVHCGDAPIEWNGQEWTGTGAVLRTNLSYKTTSISLSAVQHGTEGYRRGHVTASLPLDSTTREVCAKGYFRERKMELFLCAVDKHGRVIEQIRYAVGTMTKVSLEDNIVTFTAEDDTLDSVEKKDERRQKTVEDFRAQFRNELSHTTSSSSIGWLMNLFAATVGNYVGLLLDALTIFLKRRALAQRWHARRRTYWFHTTPTIPWQIRWKKGYAIRADTLAEAKLKLYGEVVGKIWLFPRNWMKMIVDVDGRPLEFLDLDQIRKEIDPERWKATDPMRYWERGE